MPIKSIKIVQYFSIILVLISQKLSSQNEFVPNNDISILSPTTYVFNKFGAIPVSLFTGSAQISIPITSINCGDINFPIQLSYDAGGYKVDSRPGWTGLGWNLSAGGVITRQTNGEPDEGYYDIYGTFRGSFFNNYASLDRNDWWEPDVLLSPDGPGGAPDEFSFTVNGISGSFFMNHKGKWQVKTRENNNIIVKHFISDEPLGELPYPNERRIYISKFILQTSDGMQYIFGNTPYSQETTLQALNNTSIYNGPPPTDDYQAEQLRVFEFEVKRKASVGNTWKLTEIISPKGHNIKFIYRQGGVEIQQVKNLNFQRFQYSEGSFWNGHNSANGIADNDYSTFLTVPGYLDKIITSDSSVYSFATSTSNDLKYPVDYQEKSFAIYSHVGLLNNVKYDNPTGDYTKLDQINHSYKGQNIRTIFFKYIEKPTERLKLNEVIFASKDMSQYESYKLLYNSQKLPNYSINQLDHWGYFNNRVPLNLLYGKPNDGGAAYFASREPTVDYANAEMLEKVIYPTGGYSEFFYEPHDYSKYVSHTSSISCIPLEQNKIAGGVRIRKIINTDVVTGLRNVKEYFYHTNYLSSGVLSSGVLSGYPKYFEEGTGDRSSFWQLSSNSYSFLNHTNGNHITYSEVTEKVDSGFIIHTFSNQDNGYLDKPTFAEVGVGAYSPSNLGKRIFGRLEFERGLLLSTKYYNTNKILVKEEINEYNDDPNRYNDYGRAIYLNNMSPVGQGEYSYPIYFFHPYLKKKVVHTYDNSGLNITEVNNFNWDIYRNLSEKRVSTSNHGQEIVSRYKYPYDYLNNPVYSQMASINIISPVVEHSQMLVNNATGVTKELFLTRTNYSPWNNNTMFLPGIVEKSIGGKPLIKELEYKKYDQYGNLLEIIDKTGMSNAYLWGYNSKYPVARIINSDYTAASGQVQQSVLDNGTNDQIKQQLTNLHNAFAGTPQVQIFTYTYEPLAGMASETGPAGNTTYYEYDNFLRLKTVRNKEESITKEIRYSYKSMDQCIMGGWQNTTLKRCLQDANGLYTGEEEIQQIDTCTTSPTYNQVRWKSLGQTSHCSQPIYAKLFIENSRPGSTDPYMGEANIVDLRVKFFSDPACSIPAYARPISLNFGYSTLGGEFPLPAHPHANPPITLEGYSGLIATGVVKYAYSDGMSGLQFNYTNTYFLLPGKNYTIVN